MADQTPPSHLHCGSPARIAVVGSIGKDLIFETERIPAMGESVVGLSLQAFHAGKGANMAVAAHRASHSHPGRPPRSSDYSSQKDESHGKLTSWQVYMNGAVGDDDEGRALRTGLEAQGLDVKGVHVLPGEKTGHAVVFVQPSTRDSAGLGFRGANAKFTIPPEMASNPAGVAYLAGGQKPDLVITHCTLPMPVVTDILRLAHGSGVETVLSASPAFQLEGSDKGTIKDGDSEKSFWKLVTHVVLNEHEAAEILGKRAKDLEDIKCAIRTAEELVLRGVQFAIITLGAAGAVFATNQGENGHVHAEHDVGVKDATGAGDTFVGAYAVHCLRQKRQHGKVDTRQAVVFACRAAARATEQMGSQTGMPWLDEIE